MLNRTITINSIEPAFLSMRTPLGVDLDLNLFFKGQDSGPVDPTPLKPQLTLRPRSASQVYAYDVVTVSPEQGLGEINLPGAALMDPNGFTVELYQRRDADNPANPPVPVGLLAKGVLVFEAGSYARSGPLMAINVPTIIGPAGPPGPIGPAGERGSRWTTGAGDPVVIGDEVEGDMYLNEGVGPDKIGAGDVWRFNTTLGLWVLGTF